jgi:hypothetical protein
MSITIFPSDHSPRGGRPPTGYQPSGSGQAPQNYHKGLAVLALVATIISAGAAGFGTALGLMSPDDGMVSGYVMPIVAGLTVGAVAGICWHVLIVAACRVRTTRGYIAVMVCAVGLTCVTIGASSWGCATALSGQAALRASQSDTATAEEHGLNQAWAGAQSEQAIIEVVRNSGMGGLGQIEIGGGISGHKGIGPISLYFQAAEDRCQQVATDMQKAFDKAHLEYSHGRDVLEHMRQAIGIDTETFGKSAFEVQSIISNLNAFDVAPMAAACATAGAKMPVGGQHVKRTGDAASDEIASVVQEVAAKRQPAKVPTYKPIERREATRDYAAGAAAGGWITAISIDCIPLLFVTLLGLTSEERLLLRKKRSRETFDYDREPDSDTGDDPDYDGEGDRNYRLGAQAPTRPDRKPQDGSPAAAE